MKSSNTKCFNRTESTSNHKRQSISFIFFFCICTSTFYFMMINFDVVYINGIYRVKVASLDLIKLACISSSLSQMRERIVKNRINNYWQRPVWLDFSHIFNISNLIIHHLIFVYFSLEELRILWHFQIKSAFFFFLFFYPAKSYNNSWRFCFWNEFILT